MKYLLICSWAEYDLNERELASNVDVIGEFKDDASTLEAINYHMEGEIQNEVDCRFDENDDAERIELFRGQFRKDIYYEDFSVLGNGTLPVASLDNETDYYVAQYRYYVKRIK